MMREQEQEEARPQEVQAQALVDLLRGIARGSLHEMETHLLLAQRLGYLTAEQATCALAHSDEVGRLIAGLMRSLRR